MIRYADNAICSAQLPQRDACERPRRRGSETRDGNTVDVLVSMRSIKLLSYKVRTEQFRTFVTQRLKDDLAIDSLKFYFHLTTITSRLKLEDPSTNRHIDLLTLQLSAL